MRRGKMQKKDNFIDGCMVEGKFSETERDRRAEKDL
jgi:hypothetical protein